MSCGKRTSHALYIQLQKLGLQKRKLYFPTHFPRSCLLGFPRKRSSVSLGHALTREIDKVTQRDLRIYPKHFTVWTVLQMLTWMFYSQNSIFPDKDYSHVSGCALQGMKIHMYAFFSSRGYATGVATPLGIPRRPRRCPRRATVKGARRRDACGGH